MSKFRQIVEDHSYTQQLIKVGGMRTLDHVLGGVYWAIARNAEAFPVFPGTTRLRLAKTRRVEGIGETVPRLWIWFVIEDENTVSLLYIEPERQEARYEDF